MPIIQLTEPVSPRYIHINAATNRVHLLVPIVGGQEISTDNTCKATVALRNFFSGDAMRELNSYKDALEWDIQLLAIDDPESKKALKEERLTQIYTYIEALQAMHYSYSSAVTAFLERPSNLHSIHLRPRSQDSVSRVINPAFTVKRGNNAGGVPLSSLYNAMHGTFPMITIAPVEPRAVLIPNVLAHLIAEPSIADIQTVLSEQCQHLFGLTIDFTHQPDGAVVDKAAIDTLMGFSPTSLATSEEYIDALIGMCAPNIWESIPTPPFYSIPATTPTDERTERLSIMTQFFLANLNVYCRARGISTENFGAILDESPKLSNKLVGFIAMTLHGGGDVEKTICDFVNIHLLEFKLSRSLNKSDLAAIRQKFERTYRTVTATKENPHMDDFMILDKEATGATAKCMTHQGAICVDFAEIVDPTAASVDPEYFKSIRADFASHPAEIPHGNESIVVRSIDIDIETLLTRLSDGQIERLPPEARDACKAQPSFKARHFLSCIARATPDITDPRFIKTEAEALLTANPTTQQILLRTPGIFTDYSGRTFNCTAYEYAYWAKDTHMCHMLEAHMDEKTKAFMLARAEIIEAEGLPFKQNGSEHRSTHFDLTALKTALQAYIDGFDAWYAAENWVAIKVAWMAIGKAQRDLPSHILNEYCRKDRSFTPTPQFNEGALPRVLTFHNFNPGANRDCFPLRSSNSGLGFDLTLVGFEHGGAAARAERILLTPKTRCIASVDLAAITRLDEVRTSDLTLSREHLSPPASTPPGMSV